MNYQDFQDDPRIAAAARAYLDKYGGIFLDGEPDGGLFYETEDGEVACQSPADAAQVLRDLQGGKPLPELWPELEYDPELDY